MNDSITNRSTQLTRRRILGWGGVGVVAGVTGYLGWQKKPNSTAPATDGISQPSAKTPRTIAAEPLAEVLVGRDAFLPLLKSNFRIESSAGSAATACLLVAVGDEMTMVAPTARFTSYSLLFSAPKEFAAESRIYRLSHPQMESIDLFLSPVGKSDEFVHLEAVCSQKV